MSKSLSAEEFLKVRSEIPVIDVRSPGEYLKGHILSAVSIPLFTNEERAKVGTIYKHKGKDAAVLEGLRITGPKMADYVIRSAEVARNSEVLVYCWRGGMRSGSFSWLLNTAGLKAVTLEGGYKSYRRLAQSYFEKKYKFIVIGGPTGTGKTEMLAKLKESGEQILDLEALASHRGSSFGSLGMKGQPMTEQFENLLFESLRNLDPEKRIWTEDESKSIGRVYIPDPLLFSIKSAPVYRVNVPLEKRHENLVRLYGDADPAELEEATERLRKKLGGKATDEALCAIREKRLADAVPKVLAYYDSTYSHTMKGREHLIREIQVSSGDPAEAAAALIAAADAEGTV